MRIFIFVLSITLFFSSCNNSQENKGTQSFVFSDEALSDAVLYEVNIRQFTEEGTFKAFQEFLPQLKALGVDILWLMPIHPIGETNRKGTLGSYYSIRDYRGVNPEFGTLEDFKELVAAAHDLEMFVMLDWVAGHTAWDHPWITAHPNWYIKDESGNIIPPNPDWSDVAGLNFDNADMLQALEDDMVYWVAEVGIDGYRCDAAYNISIPFWKKAIARLNAIKPVVMLAESDGNHKGGYPLIELFHMSYDWPGHHRLNQVAQGKMKATDLEDHLTAVKKNYNPKHAVMSFTSNHDENSWNGTVAVRMGAATKLMTVLTYVMPGVPLIYSGQEYGLDKRLAFFEKDFIPKTKSSFMVLYTTLNELKKTTSALDVGEYPAAVSLLAHDNENVLAFSRTKANDTLFFVGNCSATQQTVQLNVAGSYTDVFGDEKRTLSEVTLAPWEYILATN
jgi:alpha-amylase